MNRGRGEGMRDRFTSDSGVYALSGLFSVVVFVCSLLLLSWALPGGLDARRTGGLVVGYLSFIAVYAAAWYIYVGIDAREGV